MVVRAIALSGQVAILLALSALVACGDSNGDGETDGRDTSLDATGSEQADTDIADESALPDGGDTGDAADAAETEADAVAPFDRAACLVDPACDRLLVAAHRGHHTHLPENSLAALRSAARVGVDFVEIDVRHTADGALVLMHDGEVDRTTDGTGAVDALTRDQIQALTLDGGDPTDPEQARVPTFDQALQAAREEGILLYVDQKTSRTADVVAAIAARDAWDLALVRDDLIVVADMAADEPRLRVMPAIEGQAGFELAQSLIAPLHIVEIGGGVDDPELVAAIRAAGVKVQQDMLGPADVLASVGNYSGWRRAVDAGVSLPQTDFPERLVPAAAAYNDTGVFPATGPGQEPVAH